MIHFKDELLSDLEIGKVYNERQLKIFTINNNKAVLTGDIPYLDFDGKKLFKVKEIQEVYIHTGVKGVYYIPEGKIKLISLSEEL